MTLTLGLLLQAASVVLMFTAYKKSTWSRVGPYFLFAAVTYHGLTEVSQLVTGTPSQYRVYASTHAIDQWTVIVGLGCLLFTVAYITAAPRHIEPAIKSGNAVAARILAVLDWRFLLVLTVPLIAIVASGAYRYGNLDPATAASTTTSSGIADQFFLLAVTLTAISVISAHPRSFLPVFLMELAIVVLVGSRGAVVVAAVVTLFGLASLGHRPARKNVIAVGLLAELLVLSINSARSIYGRDQYTAATSISSRLQIVGLGAVGLITADSGTFAGQTQPFGERIDGNSFPAAVLISLNNGVPPVGLHTLRNDVLLAVPSVLNPRKLDTDIETRSEKLYQNDWFSIGFQGDFLPTQLGSMLGYFGIVGFLALTLLVGFAYGFLERVFAKKRTAARYIGTFALLTCALSYEHDPSVYPLTLRGAVATILVLWVFHGVRSGFSRRRVTVSPPRSSRTGQSIRTAAYGESFNRD